MVSNYNSHLGQPERTVVGKIGRVPVRVYGTDSQSVGGIGRRLARGREGVSIFVTISSRDNGEDTRLVGRGNRSSPCLRSGAT
jgi:hypothetical protein